jgi:hypothetical protein
VTTSILYSSMYLGWKCKHMGNLHHEVPKQMHMGSLGVHVSSNPVAWVPAHVT